MKASEKSSALRGLLLQLIDEAFDRAAWHGPNLRASVRRVAAEEAVWRPGRGRRNIAEITVHCAYWKYAVRRRIRGDKRGSFPLKGSNWFVLPAKLTREQWREYVGLLDQQHRTLRETIATASWSRLAVGRVGNGPLEAQVYGIAMHDTYHAGQIRTIKVLNKHATGARKTSRK